MIVDGAPADQLAHLLVLEGTLHDPVRLQREVDATNAWLRARGYLHAEVAATTEQAADSVTVRVRANLGRRYTLSRIAVTGGALPLGPAYLEHELGTTNLVGGVYRDDLFRADLDELREQHRAEGWLDVEASEPSIKIDERTGTIAVDATIKPGTRYRFGALAVKGGTAAQRAVAEHELAALRGQWYRYDARDAVVQRIVDRLDDGKTSVRFTRVRSNDAYDVTIELEP